MDADSLTWDEYQEHRLSFRPSEVAVWKSLEAAPALRATARTHRLDNVVLVRGGFDRVGVWVEIAMPGVVLVSLRRASNADVKAHTVSWLVAEAGDRLAEDVCTPDAVAECITRLLAVADRGGGDSDRASERPRRR